MSRGAAQAAWGSMVAGGWAAVRATAHVAEIAVLLVAAVRVPKAQRSQWWKEWRAELWHVREACVPAEGLSLKAEREVLAFCVGAFEDARCLRQAALVERFGEGQRGLASVLVGVNGSAIRVLSVLAVVLMVSWLVSLLLPGVQTAMHPPVYHDAHRLVMIESADRPQRTVSVAQYDVWRKRSQRLFSGFAFYRVMRERIGSMDVPVVEASESLFEVLGLPGATPMAPAADGMPGVVLSAKLWRERFGSEVMVGQVISVGGRQAVVRGIAPDGTWRIGGRAEAWLLLAESAMPRDVDGYVVGRLSETSSYPRWTSQWEMSAPTPEGGSKGFLCSSLADRVRAPQGLFLFAMIVALLALPATTSLPLGEYRVTSQKLPWGKRLRRWSYLAGKILMLVAIAYFLSIDLAHVHAEMDPIRSEYIQLGVAFVVALFGLRWALHDQRERCPVCLGKLTNPARVGHPSRNFLAWNGTELICMGGHGLLHVPEIETSWFGTQRWLYLDASWEVLFAEQGAYF
jgi:hypothetical protein